MATGEGAEELVTVPSPHTEPRDQTLDDSQRWLKEKANHAPMGRLFAQRLIDHEQAQARQIAHLEEQLEALREENGLLAMATNGSEARTAQLEKALRMLLPKDNGGHIHPEGEFCGSNCPISVLAASTPAKVRDSGITLDFARGEVRRQDDSPAKSPSE